MEGSSHDTTGLDPRQLERLLTDSWEQEIVPRLPKELNEQAEQLQAMERVRKLRRASDLLRGLLGYVLCVSSFRQLGAWAVLLGLACLSDNGWRKRLRQASDWLGWLLGELIASPQAPGTTSGGRVLLVDATCIPQAGGSGDDWRAHTAYDLLAGRIAQVTVTDQHGAESLAQVSGIRAGDIVVADNGYGYRKSVAAVAQCAAHLVIFVTPNSFPVETKQGQRIDVVAWLRQVGTGIGSLSCWCRDEQACYPVRLIALRLCDEATKRMQERKREKARKAGRTVSAEALELAGWILVATTLPQEAWPAEAVLRLYRARWHIELLFKRMKQLLRLAQVRGRTVPTALATIRALLVAWALQQEEACTLRDVLHQVQMRQQDPLDCWEEIVCSWQICEESRQEWEQMGQTDQEQFSCEPLVEVGQTDQEQSSHEQPEGSGQGPCLSVACLKPPSSWEAITADRHSSMLPDSGRPHPVSHWRLSALCLQTLRQQVQGTWTQARLTACAPLLKRYLVDSPRRRVQQETAMRCWLAPPRPGTPAGQLTTPQLILRA